MLLRWLLSLLVFDYSSGGIVFLLMALKIGSGAILFGLGLLYAAIALSGMARGRFSPTSVHRPSSACWMFVLWVAVYMTMGTFHEIHESYWDHLQTGVHDILIFFLLTSLTKKEVLRTLVPKVVVYGLIVHSVVTILTYFGFIQIHEKVALRAYGFNTNPNGTAAILVACAAHVPLIASKRVQALALTLTVIAIFFTASRSGLILLSAGIFVLLFFVYRKKVLALAIVGVIVSSMLIVIPLSYFLEETFPDRKTSFETLRRKIGFFGDEGLTGDETAAENWEFRKEVQRIGMENAWNAVVENPILGAGFDGYILWWQRDPEIQSTYTAHNAYLHFAAETGLISFTVFLLFVLRVYLDQRRSTDRMWRYGNHFALLNYLLLNLTTPSSINAKFTIFFLAVGTVPMFEPRTVQPQSSQTPSEPLPLRHDTPRLQSPALMDH